MTVSPPPTDTDRLAEVLGEHVVVSLTRLVIRCRCGWASEAPGIDVLQRMDEYRRHEAAALAPVVEQIATRRAAEELRWAAAEVRQYHGTASLTAKYIDARAAALETGL